MENKYNMRLWLTVDIDNTEKLFYKEPVRNSKNRSWECKNQETVIILPKGSIFKLIGKDLSWGDEPFEFFEVIKDSIVIDSKIIDYITKRFPQTFDVIPKEGSIWKIDNIVSYPNVNGGFPVVELSNSKGEWLRLPKSLVYG